jgi:hypothetical protein
VLINMSRAQVEALRGKFGLEATRQLLSQWDAIQNPKKYDDAKMDADDFNSIALGLGLDPLSKNKKDRAKVGNLRFHIEQLINNEQTKLKAPLTRQEKFDLVKKELAKKVLLDVWGPWDREVPALTLTPSDISGVVVPESERARIADALKQMYARTGSPLYAPTEANMQREYLLKISPVSIMAAPEIE